MGEKSGPVEARHEDQMVFAKMSACVDGVSFLISRKSKHKQPKSHRHLMAHCCGEMTSEERGQKAQLPELLRRASRSQKSHHQQRQPCCRDTPAVGSARLTQPNGNLLGQFGSKTENGLAQLPWSLICFHLSKRSSVRYCTFCVSGQTPHSLCLSVTPSHQLASSVGRPQQGTSKRV